MALVPSGKLRFMVAQTMQNQNADSSALGDANVDEQVEPRNNIEQQEIGGTGAGETPVPPVAQQGQPQKQQFDPNAHKKKQEQLNQAFDADECRKTYFALLRDAGILFREITKDARKRLFSDELANEDGVTQGTFYIPGVKQDGSSVSNSEANKIKNAIFKQFHLTGTAKPASKGSGWVANWSTSLGTETTVDADDDVAKYVGGNPYVEQQPKAKAASTMQEMLTSRHSQLVATMKKIASKV